MCPETDRLNLNRLFKCGLVSEVTANYGSLRLTNHVFNVMQSILARKSM